MTQPYLAISSQVWWIAPPRGSGCVNFRAMVEERADVWFTDYGAERSGLTYTLCEDDSPIAEPPKGPYLNDICKNSGFSVPPPKKTV